MGRGIVRSCTYGAVVLLICAYAKPGLHGQEPEADAMDEQAAKISGFRFQSQPVEEPASAEAPLALSDETPEPESAKFAVPVNIAAEELDRYRELSKLEPIESFFFPIPEKVCLPDDRTQLVDTAQSPWSANCQLVITMAGGQQAVGTGWLLSPRLVITAGHCVHEGAGGDFFANVEVIPGMNGPNQPFGSKVSGKLRAAEGWKISGTVADDYGAIILGDEFSTSDGSKPHNHGMAVLSDVDLDHLEVFVAGYPADKDFGSQWIDDDPVDAVQPQRLKYMLDTYGGNSGSAVIPVGRKEAVGIHNYGACPNHCTRITAEVRDVLTSWLAESQGN